MLKTLYIVVPAAILAGVSLPVTDAGQAPQPEFKREYKQGKKLRIIINHLECVKKNDNSAEDEIFPVVNERGVASIRKFKKGQKLDKKWAVHECDAPKPGEKVPLNFRLYEQDTDFPIKIPKFKIKIDEDTVIEIGPIDFTIPDGHDQVGEVYMTAKADEKGIYLDCGPGNVCKEHRDKGTSHWVRHFTMSGNDAVYDLWLEVQVRD